MSKKLPALVHIVWLDASHPAGVWEDKRDLNDDVDMRVDTVGFLARKTKAFVQVAVSVSGDCSKDGEQYAGLMTIPMGCVVSITTLPAGTLKD